MKEIDQRHSKSRSQQSNIHVDTLCVRRELKSKYNGAHVLFLHFVFGVLFFWEKSLFRFLFVYLYHCNKSPFLTQHPEFTIGTVRVFQVRQETDFQTLSFNLRFTLRSCFRT